MTQKKLTDEINPLETDLRKLTLNHREAELELRGRKFRLETEVEGLIAKYDDVSFHNTDDELIMRHNSWDIVDGPSTMTLVYASWMTLDYEMDLIV